MKTPLYFCALLLMAFLALPASADSLSVRLVSVSNDGNATDPGLADVAATLRQLPFSNYKIVSAKLVALPASGTVNLGAGLAVSLNGAANNLKVDVLRNGKSIYNSTLGLQPGTPFSNVIRSGNSQYLLILVLQQ